MARRWALYDHDADRMIPTTYVDYPAASLAAALHGDVLVVALGDVYPDTETEEEDDGDSSDSHAEEPG